eukprot:g3964.t1
MKTLDEVQPRPFEVLCRSRNITLDRIADVKGALQQLGLNTSTEGLKGRERLKTLLGRLRERFDAVEIRERIAYIEKKLKEHGHSIDVFAKNDNDRFRLLSTKYEILLLYHGANDGGSTLQEWKKLESEGYGASSEAIKKQRLNNFTHNLNDKQRQDGLRNAIARENFAEIEELCLTGLVDIYTETPHGLTALLLATKLYKFSTISSLVTRGKADLNVENRHGVTPLLFAIMFEKPEFIKKLMTRTQLKEKHKVDMVLKAFVVQKKKGKSSSAETIEDDVQETKEERRERKSLEKLDMIKHLLKYGAHADYETKTGRTAFLLCCEKGDTILINFFLNAVDGDDRKVGRRTNIKIKELLNRPNRYGLTPLMVVMQFRHKELLRAFISMGANTNAVDCDGRTARDWAVKCAHEDMIRIHDAFFFVPTLLKQIFDANRRMILKMMDTALSNNNFLSALAFIRTGLLEVDYETKKGYTTMNRAAYYGRDDVMEDLLVRDCGADMDHRNKDGRTPCMMAASTGQDKAIAFLIRKGADLNAVDFEGNSAIIYAARDGHASTIKLLIRAGAFVDQINTFGVTAMIAAAANHHADVVAILASKDSTYQALETNLQKLGHSYLTDFAKTKVVSQQDFQAMEKKLLDTHSGIKDVPIDLINKFESPKKNQSRRGQSNTDNLESLHLVKDNIFSDREIVEKFQMTRGRMQEREHLLAPQTAFPPLVDEEESRKHTAYNYITDGEISPLKLKDTPLEAIVITQALCKRCCKLAAEFFCMQCDSIFCEQCWGIYHAPAKRKLHKQQKYNPVQYEEQNEKKKNRKNKTLGKSVNDLQRAIEDVKNVVKTSRSRHVRVSDETALLPFGDLPSPKSSNRKRKDGMMRKESYLVKNDPSQLVKHPAELELARFCIDNNELTEARKLVEDILALQYEKLDKNDRAISATKVLQAEIWIKSGNKNRGLSTIASILEINNGDEPIANAQEICDNYYTIMERYLSILFDLKRFNTVEQVCKRFIAGLPEKSHYTADLEEQLKKLTDAREKYRLEKQARLRSRRRSQLQPLAPSSISTNILENLLIREAEKTPRAAFELQGVQHFFAFLKREKILFIAEFWIAVHHFRKTFDVLSPDTKTRMQYIHKTYIRPHTSTFLIHKHRQNVKKALVNPTKTIFDEAQALALGSLYFGGFMKFLADKNTSGPSFGRMLSTGENLKEEISKIQCFIRMVLAKKKYQTMKASYLAYFQ